MLPPTRHSSHWSTTWSLNSLQLFGHLGTACQAWSPQWVQVVRRIRRVDPRSAGTHCRWCSRAVRGHLGTYCAFGIAGHRWRLHGLAAKTVERLHHLALLRQGCTLPIFLGICFFPNKSNKIALEHHSTLRRRWQLNTLNVILRLMILFPGAQSCLRHDRQRETQS